MAVELERVVLVASGAAMLLLATLILAAGAGRPLHRAFAALVAARGGAVLVTQLSSDPQWLWTAVHLQPYFTLAIPPLAAYVFATTLPGVDRRRAGWLCMGAIAVLETAYLANHALVHSIEPGVPAIGALHAVPGYTYTAFGPLYAVVMLGPILLAALGVRLAIVYRTQPDGPDAVTFLLMATGLLTGALFDGANRLSAMANLLDGSAGYPWLPWGWAVLALPVLALVPALLGVAVLASGRSLDPRPAHRLETIALVLFLLAFFSGFLRLVAPPDSDVGGHPLVLLLLGLWRLAMPVLVAYALLRRDPAGQRLTAPAPLGAADA